MFTGLHLLEPEVFDLLPARGCIVRQLYRPLIDEGRTIGGHVDAGSWVDLGTLNDYLSANLALAEGRLALAHLPSPPADGRWISPEAVVADPAFLGTPVVIGRNALIRAPITRAVVWEGAVVDKPIHDAVVTPRGVVRVLS
jgi:NDP-sugar pyrophosphorylase family protein